MDGHGTERCLVCQELRARNRLFEGKCFNCCYQEQVEVTRRLRSTSPLREKFPERERRPLQSRNRSPGQSRCTSFYQGVECIRCRAQKELTDLVRGLCEGCLARPEHYPEKQPYLERSKGTGFREHTHLPHPRYEERSRVRGRSPMPSSLYYYQRGESPRR
jgi:hypothetical protein